MKAYKALLKDSKGYYTDENVEGNRIDWEIG